MVSVASEPLLRTRFANTKTHCTHASCCARVSGARDEIETWLGNSHHTDNAITRSPNYPRAHPPPPPAQHSHDFFSHATPHPEHLSTTVITNTAAHRATTQPPTPTSHSFPHPSRLRHPPRPPFTHFSSPPPHPHTPPPHPPPTTPPPPLSPPTSTTPSPQLDSRSYSAMGRGM